MPLTAGQVLNNRYRIDALLGRGGFGAVYRAWDSNLERWSALKENLDTSPDAQRQFKREAQILAGLSHPNLPKVIDHFIIPNQGQYLVMDFVEGDDLQRLHDNAGGPLQLAKVIAWIDQVCDALVYLHSQVPPVIHRDIKPANIRLTPWGHAILVDFGIAKSGDISQRTTVGARAYSSGFSPPEQYGQGATDAQSDLYSLGATLYLLLTSVKLPDSLELMVNRLQPVRLVAELNPAVPPAISAAVMRAIALDRSQRWPTVAAFRQALKEASTDRISNIPSTHQVSEPPGYSRTQAYPSSGGSNYLPSASPPNEKDPAGRFQDRRVWLWLAAGLISIGLAIQVLNLLLVK